ncbi:hypothetical protein Oweho_3473 [Owenweeksia hongkongensis DSM 17368]|uniref:Uncharacterized protein n=1 Tax=Owenweeksia hongkongensis (strain DSM 17368 / CIP 108786 / JCM 12287 / NRRL B-23963 / UST20020801) TaxID=926562 RepID=G8R6F9_OWEHD|nr:hypothetical protein [Owenweeksia hongkongensis]AEV34422.1 hypothetical protein Oweho_3473 [Owenweeksia hongkongensis DSM 17368]
MSTLSRINSKIDQLQFSYYGIMSVTLMAGSYVASVALIVILMNNAPTWQIALISCTAMGSNAAAISHAPLRWVVWSFITNILASLFLILISLF